ncbi:helix-turn-helix domain-containing protein [Streptomyces sp. NPDC096080]|uniref:helix-turn-helix domain-containing protein n=1 Tax=Streptomyces sp. NPDC096080 TaxID=3156693 RepID=UPI0033319C9E
MHHGTYGTADVARLLGITPATVRKLVQRGQLTPCGGTPRFPRYDRGQVGALLANRHGRPAA